MEPTYYVSPNGVEQLVSTQAEVFRLKYRGWKPKQSQLPELPATPIAGESEQPTVKPRRHRAKKSDE